jgi:hypothetical protein
MVMQDVDSPSRWTTESELRPHLVQFDSSEEYESNSDYEGEDPMAPMLRFPEPSQEVESDWQPVRRRRETPKKTFDEFELEEKQRKEKREAERAAELEIRKASRPPPPPPGDIPGVPGQLVPNKPVSQDNRYSLLGLD